MSPKMLSRTRLHVHDVFHWCLNPVTGAGRDDVLGTDGDATVGTERNDLSGAGVGLEYGERGLVVYAGGGREKVGYVMLNWLQIGQHLGMCEMLKFTERFAWSVQLCMLGSLRPRKDFDLAHHSFRCFGFALPAMIEASSSLVMRFRWLEKILYSHAASRSAAQDAHNCGHAEACARRMTCVF